MIFTGRSRSYAYKILNQVREGVGKSKHGMVTIQEFAEFHCIPVRELEEVLFGKPWNQKGPAGSRSFVLELFLRRIDVPAIGLFSARIGIVSRLPASLHFRHLTRCSSAFQEIFEQVVVSRSPFFSQILVSVVEHSLVRLVVKAFSPGFLPWSGAWSGGSEMPFGILGVLGSIFRSPATATASWFLRLFSNSGLLSEAALLPDTRDSTRWFFRRLVKKNFSQDFGRVSKLCFE